MSEIPKAVFLHPEHQTTRIFRFEMSFLLLFALLPSVAYTTFIQPNTNAISPQTNGSLVPIQLVNATLFGVDPRFSIEPEDGPNSIDRISAYMNTIGLLVFLATEDFGGELMIQTISLPTWSDIGIVVTTVNEHPLAMRIAIWGLFQAIYYMSEYGFTDGDIFLQWDGQRVGVVEFHLTSPDSLQAAGSNSLNSTKIVGLEAECTSDTVYKPNGQDLSDAGIYVSLASALANMAEGDATDHMFEFARYIPEFQTRIGVKPEPRSAPPKMSIANGIAAVWSTANFITRQRRYAEYSTSISAGNVLLGVITVDKEEDPPAVQASNGAAVPPGVATT